VTRVKNLKKFKNLKIQKNHMCVNFNTVWSN